MKKQNAVLASLVLFFSALFFLTSCKKINEATELGGELIPPVDNITTFDTTLEVEVYNHLFNEQNDSTSGQESVVQYLGSINNDPIFGKSEASMFLELKPASIRAPFPFKKDSLLGLDSIVLVLGYNSTFGDTTLPQQVRVYEIPVADSFVADKRYLIRQNYFNPSQPLGPSKMFVPATLNDSVFSRGERAANQLRIPLDASFGERLLNYDTTNAYNSQADFKKFFAGFAILPEGNGGANALVGFNVSDTNTKLSMYVRYKNAGRIDTSVVYFRLTNTSDFANYIKRDYAGSQLASYLDKSVPSELAFVQTAPGSYVRIKVPGLASISNRVVHRAELIAEQVYDPQAPVFSPPVLYLDALDTTKNKYRIIPLDVGLSVTTTDGNNADTVFYSLTNAEAFGMLGKKTVDFAGNSIYRWTFNISRYIQHVVNDTETAQELRLYAPRSTIRNIVNNSAVEQYITNPVFEGGDGRVQLGGGLHPTQKMRLRIIYSKL